MHDFFDVVGDLAQLDGISPRHSKRDRERRVRAKDQLRRANPRFRREAIGGGLAQARFEMIPCLCIRRQNDNLRERGIGQLRVVGKEKPWSTRADVGSHDLRFGLLRQPMFDLLGRGARRLDACP